MFLCVHYLRTLGPRNSHRPSKTPDLQNHPIRHHIDPIQTQCRFIFDDTFYVLYVLLFQYNMHQLWDLEIKCLHQMSLIQKSIIIEMAPPPPPSTSNTTSTSTSREGRRVCTALIGLQHRCSCLQTLFHDNSARPQTASSL
jgi:hypothetical protein